MPSMPARSMVRRSLQRPECHQRNQLEFVPAQCSPLVASVLSPRARRDCTIAEARQERVQDHADVQLPRFARITALDTARRAVRLGPTSRRKPWMPLAPDAKSDALRGPALTLATVSFALSFAGWGLIGGLAPVFAGLYQLSASQTALLVAVPVLLGSLARLPMGMLTDRFGGRLVFTLLLVFASARRLPRSAHDHLSIAAGGRLPDRHGGLVVRGWCGVRLTMDAGDTTRHRARHLRTGHAGAIAGRLRWTGRRSPPGMGDGVSWHECAAARVGVGLFGCWRAIRQTLDRRPLSPR